MVEGEGGPLVQHLQRLWLTARVNRAVIQPLYIVRIRTAYPDCAGCPSKYHFSTRDSRARNRLRLREASKALLSSSRKATGKYRSYYRQGCYGRVTELQS